MLWSTQNLKFKNYSVQCSTEETMSTELNSNVGASADIYHDIFLLRMKWHLPGK